MAKINLSEEDLKILSEYINNETEIPQELLTKLAPSFFDKLNQEGQFDFEKLHKFKIPTLEYAGKRPESIILAQANLTTGAAPLQVIRKFGSNDNDNQWRNLIVQGDNLQFLKTCYLNKDPLIKDKVKGKVKLIYIDPPFGTGDEYGGKNGEMSYSAKMMGSEFIENIRERLIYLRELLSNEGFIFIRMDYHFAHYIKIITDDVFGKEKFINEILIGRKREGAGTRNKLDITTESIYLYSKSNYYNMNDVFARRSLTDIKWTSFLMAEERKPRERTFFGITLVPPKGQHFSLKQEKCDRLVSENFIRLRCKECGARYYYAEDEKDLQKRMKHKKHKFKFYDINSDTIFYNVKELENKCLECGKNNFTVDYLGSDYEKVNNNWLDLRSYSSTTGYPTENSESLLERVISACSNNDDFVLDCFAGSGTTGAVAEKLGRRWIMCDFGKHSIYTMQKRIWQIGESKKLGTDAKKNEKYSLPPNPFAIVSAGAYDFSKIIDLRKNKEAYMNFVLGLFGIIADEKDYTAKYKINNIYAEKENNPVEVFPIWDDDYLKNIKIDEEYLREIVNAAGSRLKGDYYIITPETCTVVGNTTLKNSTNEEVNFILLKFPYKLLEDFSRQMQIEEQPDSQENINKLISSSAFYFNEEVQIKLTRTEKGFRINEFQVNILDKSNNRFKGLDGLSMLLIDKNYDGKVFNLDAAVYKKDIVQDGTVKIDGLKPHSAVIAIDKHGNESEATYLT